MARRKIYDYIDDDGESCLEVWIQSQRMPGLDAVIDARLQGLEVVDDLRRPAWDKLTGNCMGLYEARIDYKGVCVRVICCFGPGQGEITILGAATKRGRTFNPRNICQVALGRKARITEKGRTSEHF